MSATTVDLKSTATIPIRLGRSILDSEKTKERYASIRYNHRPELSSTADDLVSHLGSDGQLVLHGDDDDERYTYSGHSTTGPSGQGQYVLLFQGEGDDRNILLERLESSHDFNLISTSTESDASKLAEEHPQILFENSDSDDLFGEDDGLEAPLDDSNPFDFRHFLTLSPEQPPEPDPEPPRKGPAADSTRSMNHASDTSQASASKSKRKPAANSKKSLSKRVRAGAPEEPSPAAAAELDGTSQPRNQRKQQQPSVPQLKLDRKASIRGNQAYSNGNSNNDGEDDDDGELILENETPITEKPRHGGAMALALSGQLGNGLGSGPFSLRSAANSPASQFTASPMPARPVESDEDGDELGDAEDDGEGMDVDDEEEEEEDEHGEREDADDGDVEDLALPSPAQQEGRARSPLRHHDPDPASESVAGDDDMMAELERELQQELGQQEDEDGEVAAAPPAEEEEVSEEE